MADINSVWSTWYRMVCPLCNIRISGYESSVGEAEFRIVRHVRQEHGPPEVHIAKELLAEDNRRFIKVDRHALRPTPPAGQTTTKMKWAISCPHSDRCQQTITKKEEKDFAILTAISMRRIMLYAFI